MKKLYFLLIITFVFSANAHIVNIPDANFKAKLLSASASNQVASTIAAPADLEAFSYFFSPIDSNNDGEIQISEAQAIKWLNISNSNISDLTGIEEFTNLYHINCSSNQILNIDFSSINNLEIINSSNNQIQNMVLPLNVWV